MNATATAPTNAIIDENNNFPESITGYDPELTSHINRMAKVSFEHRNDTIFYIIIALRYTELICRVSVDIKYNSFIEIEQFLKQV